MLSSLSTVLNKVHLLSVCEYVVDIKLTRAYLNHRLVEKLDQAKLAHRCLQKEKPPSKHKSKSQTVLGTAPLPRARLCLRFHVATNIFSNDDARPTFDETSRENSY